jgi:hypothetical protein
VNWLAPPVSRWEIIADALYTIMVPKTANPAAIANMNQSMRSLVVVIGFDGSRADADAMRICVGAMKA